MSSLIQTMIMGAPTTRRLWATASALYLLALGLGFALTLSNHTNVQSLGLLLTAAAAIALWRSHRKAQARLARSVASDGCWQALLTGSADSIMVLVPRQDVMGRFVGWEICDANDRAHDLFVDNHRSLISLSLSEILPAAMHTNLGQCLEIARATRRPQADTHALHAADSTDAPRCVHHQIIPCDAGIVLITRDVSQAHADALQRTNEQLRQGSRVLDASGSAVVVSNALDRIESVNPAFLHMTGLSPAEVIGKGAELVGLAPLRESHLPGVIDALRSAQHWSGESSQIRADGRSLDTWLSVSTLRNDTCSVTQHIRVFSDISALKDRQRELVEQARHDSLTGLPNRRAFAERLNQAMARARRNPQTLAVLYIDLDGFKAVNDGLGHAAGDAVLVEVARRLQDSVRLTDCVCRLAGDEFTVILEGAGPPGEVRRICQRVLDRLSQPHVFEAAQALVTPSIGAAVYEAGETPEQMCQRADAAMYVAKHAGKARFVLSIPERAESANALAVCQGAN